jgi:hypothetical protein
VKLTTIGVALSIAIYPEVAGASDRGFVVFVLDNNNQGVYSNIYEVESNTLSGTTGADGKLTATDYRCPAHKTIQAKPLDKIYFDPAPAPCRSPEHFVVETRVMPKGDVAFDQFSTGFVYADGSPGLVNFKSAVGVKTSEVKEGNGGENCNINYALGVEKNKYKLGDKGWNKVANAVDSPSTFVVISGDELRREIDQDPINWGAQKPMVVEKDNGINLHVPRPCGDVKGQAAQFGHVLTRFYDNKIKAGAINQQDVTSFVGMPYQEK